MKEQHGILVVDDESSVRQSLQRWFEQDGFRVGTAANATEALKSLSEATWDIVLLDIRMPGMGGLDLLSRIRDIDSDIIVIMITGYAAVDSAVEALKRGAFDYVAKPFDPEELSHLVGRALQQPKT
jgi:DNA-binding NtrC family response regulator